MRIVFICFTVIYGFVYLVLAAKTGRPIRTVALGAGGGLLAIFVLHFTAGYSGISMPINWYTVGTSAALGLPGTIGLLFLRLLFVL